MCVPDRAGGNPVSLGALCAPGSPTEGSILPVQRMPLYTWAVRPALFALDAERAHNLTLAALRRPFVVRTLRALVAPRADPRLDQRVLGLTFRHPVGLAAGLDKHGTAAAAWAALGFAFVEIGTVTPQPQAGNPRPRLFRLPADRAIINRLGFNSVGAAEVAQNLAAMVPLPIPIGINLGKNRQTSNDNAADDYMRALEIVHPFADYVVVNVSSPNTPGLRALQESRALRELVAQVVHRARALTTRKMIPVLVKVAPDMTPGDLLASVDAALEGGASAIIATNTTVARPGLKSRGPAVEEDGGLSGAPLRSRATEICRTVYAHLRGGAPIVGVGGIFTADDAYERIRSGASLVQLYTALIYEGPGVVGRIVRGLGERLIRDGFSHVSEAVGADVR
jgi:dihydroorotate dehydrogenase